MRFSGLVCRYLLERSRNISGSMLTGGFSLLLMAVSLGVRAQNIPVLSGSHAVTHLKFVVATVRPSRSAGWKMSFTLDGFSASGVTLQLLVQEAYGAYFGDYVTGGPAWAADEHFDVQAKLDTEEIADFQNLSLSERRDMLKVLLADRFKLLTHEETHTSHGYAIEVAKGSSKLQKADPDDGTLGGVLGYDCSWSGRGPYMGDLKATNCTIQDLSKQLAGTIAPKVIDHTGLSGHYNFELHWTPDRTINGQGESAETEESPPLRKAMQDQLDLKLVPAEVPVKAIVIDHAERPVEN